MWHLSPNPWKERDLNELFGSNYIKCLKTVLAHLNMSGCIWQQANNRIVFLPLQRGCRGLRVDSFVQHNI